jgi:phosphopentomutase
MDRMVGETTGRARLVVANLVDTDQVHGHRKDAAGFAQALQTIDEHVGQWLAALRPDELLILTADHGCDITASHSDHTREYVPLLAYAPGIVPGRHDGPMVDVAQTALDWVGATDPAECPGTNFVR